MGATHFSGPVFSKAGFAGQIDPTTGNLLTGPLFLRPPPVALNTAGNVTFTVTQVLNGTIMRECNGANRTDILPTAQQIVAQLNSLTVYSSVAQIGMSIPLTIMNTSTGAFTEQITMGTGGTAVTANVQTPIAQNTSKSFTIILTNVTPGSEAYSVYA